VELKGGKRHAQQRSVDGGFVRGNAPDGEQVNKQADGQPISSA
jgi:hypothetical protein